MSQSRLVPMRGAYLLDANIFMTAWRDHYPPDLCPGFWQCLEHHSRNGRLLSIDRVRDEIINPPDLVEWVRQVSGDMFASSREPVVNDVYSEIQQWVNDNAQFSPAAKDEFARVADGWFAAYAKVHEAVLVTNEVFHADARRRVPLPNICKQFDTLPPINTLQMLRELGVRFDWNQNP